MSYSCTVLKISFKKKKKFCGINYKILFFFGQLRLQFVYWCLKNKKLKLKMIEYLLIVLNYICKTKLFFFSPLSNKTNTLRKINHTCQKNTFHIF